MHRETGLPVNCHQDANSFSVCENPMPRIVYSRKYNIGFYGLERFHPFDSRKYGRAWKLIQNHFGKSIRPLLVKPRRQVNRDEMQLVHNAAYLKKLKSSRYVAAALELPQIQRLPNAMINWHVLRPMRWATMGTIVAARECLQHGLAVNLAGGFHHAKPDRGEGFCIYSDIGIAIKSLRLSELISEKARVAFIDTDAHQGNGVCHTFLDDERVAIFDIFNSEIYPAWDLKARKRVDCKIELAMGCSDVEYMEKLHAQLPGFLESFASNEIGIAIYNAGTDVFRGDPLGGLEISMNGIRERDLFVVGELRKRGIPTVMVLSGGYTRQSFQLVANSVIPLLELELAR